MICCQHEKSAHQHLDLQLLCYFWKSGKRAAAAGPKCTTLPFLRAAHCTTLFT